MGKILRFFQIFFPFIAWSSSLGQSHSEARFRFFELKFFLVVTWPDIKTLVPYLGWGPQHGHQTTQSTQLNMQAWFSIIMTGIIITIDIEKHCKLDISYANCHLKVTHKMQIFSVVNIHPTKLISSVVFKDILIVVSRDNVYMYQLKSYLYFLIMGKN